MGYKCVGLGVNVKDIRGEDGLEHGVRWIKEEYGRPMKVIGTGGLAPLFDTQGQLFDAVEDDLTMHGLTVIYNYNKGLEA